MTEKRYTWEEKIDSLVKLAKIAGSYIEASREDPGSDGHKELRRKLREAYDEFCEWRHDEPYVVDEIWELLRRREYTDEQTGIRFIVEQDNYDYPDYPKLTVICPPDITLSIEQVNGALQRLQNRAGISLSHRMPPLRLTTQSDP